MTTSRVLSDVEQLLNKIPWMIWHNGKSYQMIITRNHPLWVMLYWDQTAKERLYLTHCCTLSGCAKQFYVKLKDDGIIKVRKRVKKVIEEEDKIKSFVALRGPKNG